MSEVIDSDVPVFRGGATLAQLRGQDPEASELWRVDPAFEFEYLNAVEEIQRDFQLMTFYERTTREGGSMLYYARNVARSMIGMPESIAPLTTDWPGGLMDGSHTSLGWLIHVDALQRARETVFGRESDEQSRITRDASNTCRACGALDVSVSMTGGLCSLCRTTARVLNRREQERIADARVGKLGKSRADIVRNWLASSVSV